MRLARGGLGVGVGRLEAGERRGRDGDEGEDGKLESAIVVGKAW